MSDQGEYRIRDSVSSGDLPLIQPVPDLGHVPRQQFVHLSDGVVGDSGQDPVLIILAIETVQLVGPFASHLARSASAVRLQSSVPESAGGTIGLLDCSAPVLDGPADGNRDAGYLCDP